MSASSSVQSAGMPARPGRALLGDTLGGQRQGIHQVRQAHQVMIALQGMPVIREGVFIVVALTLFDQEAGLDA